MENNLVGFKKYNGKKSDLLNITVEPGDIIFGIDSETNLPYIYHNNVFYSDASEWSEALPEIHIGKRMPPEKDPYIKLWLDSNANPPTLKYKNSVTNDWENVSSNIDITETNEIFIGDNLPADISDNVKVWYQTNVDIPDSPTEEVSWGDIKNKPEFAKVATSGSYTDLKDVPDAIKKTYYAHGQVDRSKYTLTDEQLIDNINTQKSIENKENANYIIHVVDTDKYYPVNKVSQEASYVKTLYAVVFEDDDNNIGNDTVNPIVTSVKLNIHNGEILGGIPSGGSGDAFVDSAYLSTKGYVNSHTTTYIGKDSPSTISSKYNLWVDTSKEEVVFKYKAGNEWKVLSTGGSSSIEVDTELSATSENPIANKVVYELATVIGEDFEAISKDLLKKASTENGLVEGRGFKVNDNLKYYLPNTTVTTDPTVDDTHIIATKADTLSNEVIDSKATVYNLYAMDGLTPEQVAANEAALVSVQNREIAIYKVYTSDDTYAIADVKLVPGPYLEAYVYVSNPDTTSEQVTVTKYTYTFNQAGEYTTIDKQEVVVPSLSKVEEMIDELPSGGGSITLDSEMSDTSTNAVSNKVIKEYVDNAVANSGGGGEGTGGGLETRVLYVPNFTAGGTLTPEEKAYNLETCQKLLAGTARAAISLEGEVAGSYALNTYCEDVLDLSVLGDEGYYIPFKWTYAVQLGATVVGPDGDILLFGGGGQSTPVSDLILNEDLSNLGDIGSAVMEQYNGGKLPMVYYVENDRGSLLQLVPLHPFATFSNIGITLQGIGESFDGNEQTQYVLYCYAPGTGVAHEFEAIPIATKIYIGKPSTEHKNINKAFANKPFGALGINPMPTLVYEDSSSAEILRWKSYQPLEKYIVPNLESGDWGDYTHIEFLIFREGKYERWKLDMEGITSLIE